MVSEIVTLKGQYHPELPSILNFDLKSLDMETFTAGIAVDLISLPMRIEELATSHLTEESLERASESLDRFGVVLLQSIIPLDVCKRAAADIAEQIKDPKVTFGNIMESEFRHDYPLEIGNNATDAIFTTTMTFIDKIITRQLGNHASVVEYSSLVSLPGAGQQGVHPDTNMKSAEDFRGVNKMISVFVSLADVDVDMAALDVWPGTHTHVHLLPSEQHELLVSAPAVRLKIPAGTAVLMDSRTFHRGSSNNSTKPRPVQYFSFAEDTDGKAAPDGATYSMRDEYWLEKPKRGSIRVDQWKKSFGM